MRYLFLVLVMSASVCDEARAACNNLNYTLVTSSHSFNTNTAPNLILRVTRNNQNNNSCNFFFTFELGGAPNYNSRTMANGTYTIPFQIYRDGTFTDIMKNLASATTNADVITGSYASGSGGTSQDLTFTPKLGTVDTYQRYGSYSNSFNIVLYEGTLASRTQKRSRSMTVSYTMAKVIDLSLVDTSASFNSADTTQTLNLGSNMQVGNSASFDVVLKYNAGYTVRFSSTNNGRMKHSSTNAYVDYTMTYNGSNVNLSGSSTTPVQVDTGTGASAASGLRRAVVATVSNLNGNLAGTYTDTIQVSVVSSE